MNFNISNETAKSTVFEQIATELKKENFTNIKEDQSRPWGVFL
jgi:mannose-6-phosphate isomerase|nr:hypothetical protein [uncultured Flavobacterium sp.]